MQSSWLFGTGDIPFSLQEESDSIPHSSASFPPHTPPQSNSTPPRTVVSTNDEERKMPSVASRSPERSTQPATATLDTDSPPTADSSDHQASPPSPQPPPSKAVRDKGKRKASVSEKSGNGNTSKENKDNEAANAKKKVKVGARASIACTTCRKRKVRCSGEWPTCAFCTGRKMECVYNGHPAETGGTTNAGPSGYFSHHEPVQTPTEAVLPNSQLTIDAIDTFLTHYHDTFPFLHRQSLIDSVRNGSASRELICSILALAARFCQPLRDLHPSSSSAASEYYAVLASQLLSLPDAKPLFPSHAATVTQLPDSEVTLTRCQCYLLLSLYELTAGRDHSGWLKLGQAIRMAQILRLGFDDEVDYPSAALGDDPRGRGRSTSTSANGSRDSSSSRTSGGAGTNENKVHPRPASVDPLKAETRRRTFWSCFLLDRTISDGNERPCGLKVPKISSLRMPGSDADFASGRKGMGAKFDPDPPAWSLSVRVIEQRKEEEEEAMEKERERKRLEAKGGKVPRSRTTTFTTVEPEADLYGFTLRIADIWRSVASYIGAGGRNVDRRPPWQSDSTFFALAGQLNEFGDRLPQELRYSTQTLIAHCMTSSMDARLFGMLHLLFATASHVLHRDYLPFLPPADFQAGNGPVDGEPLYGDSTPPPDCPHWWQTSFDVAEHSAGIISDVCTNLASHGIVLAHPFAGFAALAAGTVHCHLKYWPQEKHSAERAGAYFQQDAAILQSLKNVYPIAARWCDSLAGLQLLYYNLARGILDADPLKVRAGVIQLLRSAKDEQESSNHSTLISESPNTNGPTNGNVTLPQPPTLPPLNAPHQRVASQAQLDHIVPTELPAPSYGSSNLSLTSSLLPVPGSDLPNDWSVDLNAMASVPGFGFGFDDLGYWGSGGGWLSGGFGGLGAAAGNTMGNGGSLFGGGTDMNWM